MRTSEYTDACCTGLFARIVCRAVLLFFILSISGLASFAQIITTYAGGPPLPVSGQPAVTQAIAVPGSVAPDGAGGFFVSSRYQNRVYHVGADGTLTLTAGSGKPGSSGDGGLAISAQLYAPADVAVDGAGNLFIADSGNQRIRKVSPAGTITTVAGIGKPEFHSGLLLAIPGFSGDGGPATSAQLNGPVRVAVDGAGNLFIADSGNQRIRKVSPAGTITTVAGIGIVLFDFSGDGGPPT